MNPVPAMKLVEIIRGLATSEATFQQTRALAEQLGKTTMTAQDFPGFIVNRVARPYYLQALRALERVAAHLTVEMARARQPLETGERRLVRRAPGAHHKPAQPRRARHPGRQRRGRG